MTRSGAIPAKGAVGKKSTLHDVARRANVSYQTVSRVINDHPNVASDTRARVEDAIRELGYIPNRAAQSLVTSRSSTIGIVSYGIELYGPLQMVSNTEHALKNRGYDLIFSSVDHATANDFQKQIERLQGQLVDGLVVVTPAKVDDLRDMVAHIKVPYVVVDVQLGSQYPTVCIDQKTGGWLATQHLIDIGHRRIAEIAGQQGWSGAEQRHQGFTDAMLAAHLDDLVFVHGDWTAASGYDATVKLLNDRPGFTALVVGNDQMAMGAIAALRDSGLAVPDDVSVVGFDDIPESAYMAPPLTTVRQDFRQLGLSGAAALLKQIESKSGVVEQKVIQPELVVRRSTAPIKPD